LPAATADGRETRRAALRAGAMEFVERSALSTQALTRAIEDAIDRFAPWRTDPSVTRSMDSIGSSQAQLHAVINAMADGVVIFDMKGSVVLLNEAEAWINGFATATEMMRDLPFFAERFELFSDDGQFLSVEEWPVSRVLRGETITQLRLRTRRRD